MANDNILRLKVDSKEYDSKIERARQGLLHLEQELQKTGKNFADVDKDQLAFVQGLGQMETVTNDAKGKLRELTKATTDLTAMYRRLTDEEKNSPVGQAMAASIQTLVERAGEVKDAMADVQASIKNAASDTRAFDQVSQGISLMTSSFQTAIGAAKLLGIELDDNVEVIAKLQAAMAVTNGLQQAQNLLQKESALMMSVTATQAKALAMSQALMAKETKIATVAQKAFNVVAKANPYVLLATAVAAVAAGYVAWQSVAKKAKDAQKQLTAEIDSTLNELKNLKTESDFHIAIREAAGASKKELYNLRMEAAKTAAEIASVAFYNAVAAGPRKKPDNFEELKQAHLNAQNRINELLKEGIVDYVKTNSGGNRNTKGGGGSTSKVEQTEMAANSERIDKLKEEYIKATDQRRQAIEAEIATLQKRNAEIQKLYDMAEGKAFDAGELGEVSVVAQRSLAPLQQMQEALKSLNEQLEKAKTPEAYQEILSDIKAVEKEMKVFKGDLGAKDLSKDWTNAAQAIQSVGQALSQIEDPAAKVMSIIAQAIATIALTFAQSLKGTMTPWDWIAGAAAGTATMISTIAAIKSATAGSYAEGGIIPGNNHNDGLIANVSSGELILNRAQQGVVADALQNSEGGGRGYTPSHVSGEQIWIALNAFTKRTGRGELVTWR